MDQFQRVGYEKVSATKWLGGHSSDLLHRLQRLNEAYLAPDSTKVLRKFSTVEAAKWIGVSDTTLKRVTNGQKELEPELFSNNRRLYTLEQMNKARALLAETLKSKNPKDLMPHREGEEALQVIAITNFKGGSGKTTTTVHLAQYLALRGYRVLAVDLDPQASLTAMLGLTPELDVDPNTTLYGAVRYDDERRPLKDIIRKTFIDGLHVVPGNLELMEFEHVAPNSSVYGHRPFYQQVNIALNSVADDYDIVIIDCPPQLGYLTMSALAAATAMFITIHPQMLDVASMGQFLVMMEDLLSVIEKHNGSLDLDFMRVLITRYEPQDAPQTRIVTLLRDLFGTQVLTNAMVKSSAVSDAGLTKQTVYEIGRENMTRSTYDRATASLDAVNGEIENLIKAAWRRT